MRPKERLLRKGKISDKVLHKSLEQWSDRLRHWEKFFTALVVLGVVIEYLPDIIGISEAVAHHARILREIGGLLVIIGVAGELIVSVRASRVETDLREISNATLAAALERAAIAEQAAAEANLARAKIEEKLFKPHVLSQEDIEAFAEILRRHQGHKRVDIFICDSHLNEVLRLADSINAAFCSGGWKCKMWIGVEPRMMGREVTFAIAREWPMHTDENQALQQLAGRLHFVQGKIGIGTMICPTGFSTSELPSVGRIWDLGPERRSDIPRPSRTKTNRA